jgi:hypothetical protein
MKCPKHKTQMRLQLSTPADNGNVDTGWICGGCPKTYYPLTERENRIWKAGFKHGVAEHIHKAKLYDQIRNALVPANEEEY